MILQASEGNQGKDKQFKVTMEKQKNKNIVAIIFLIIVSLVLIAGCSVNMVFAYIKEGNVNLFTAISGWVGFLATAGVGVITIFQNKRSERNLIRETEINKLSNVRTILYLQKMPFLKIMMLLKRQSEFLIAIAV